MPLLPLSVVVFTPYARYVGDFIGLYLIFDIFPCFLALWSPIQQSFVLFPPQPHPPVPVMRYAGNMMSMFGL